MDILQSLDQLSAFLRDFSPVLMGYKKQLIKDGFSEEEAFRLVRDYQIAMINGSKE